VKGSLLKVETGHSKEARNCHTWEVSWLDERFSAQLICGNSACGNVAVVCGRVESEEHWYYKNDSSEQVDVVATYVPSFFLRRASGVPDCSGMSL
jgi:hypothetical protein